MTTCVQVWWGLTNTVSHHYMLTSVRTFVITSTHHWKPSTFLNTDKTSEMLLLKYYLFTKYAESIRCSGWWPPSVQWLSDMLSWDWFISSDTTTLTTNHTKDWTHLSTVLPTYLLLSHRLEGEIMKIFKCQMQLWLPANDVALKQDASAFKILKQNPLAEFNMFSAFLRFPHPGEISENLSRHLPIKIHLNFLDLPQLRWECVW